MRPWKRCQSEARIQIMSTLPFFVQCQAGKEVVLCYVARPRALSDRDLRDPSCITQFKVRDDASSHETHLALMSHMMAPSHLTPSSFSQHQGPAHSLKAMGSEQASKCQATEEDGGRQERQRRSCTGQMTHGSARARRHTRQIVPLYYDK